MIYAVFMCMIALPERCILMASAPNHDMRAIAEGHRIMTSLAQCNAERKYYLGSEMPGWKIVCLKQPAWEPAN